MYSVNKTSAKGTSSPHSKKSSSGARKAEAEERTRDRVLRGVLNHGPVSAANLGELLSLTPAAVRRHLDALEQANMIEVARSNSMVRAQGAPPGATSSPLKGTSA